MKHFDLQIWVIASLVCAVRGIKCIKEIVEGSSFYQISYLIKPNILRINYFLLDMFSDWES
jgi:hypothetical protein